MTVTCAPGAAAIATPNDRRGSCRECQAETEHVALWNACVVWLCPACAAAIRAGG